MTGQRRLAAKDTRKKSLALRKRHFLEPGGDAAMLRQSLHTQPGHANARSLKLPPDARSANQGSVY
jgi:hypothetical protein